MAERTALDVLRGAREILSEEGRWVQGTYWRSNGKARVCLVGAMVCAYEDINPDDLPDHLKEHYVDHEEWGGMVEDEMWDDVASNWCSIREEADTIWEAADALISCIDSASDDDDVPYEIETPADLTGWNDNLDRTYEEIVDALDCALRAKGGQA